MLIDPVWKVSTMMTQRTRGFVHVLKHICENPPNVAVVDDDEDADRSSPLQSSHADASLLVRTMVRVLASAEAESFVARFLATHPPLFTYDL